MCSCGGGHWSPSDPHLVAATVNLTTGLVSNLLLHLWHRVLLLWEQGVRVIAVIARLRTHPHATYHTVMQGTTMHIAMYHISRTTLYNTMYHTLICRKQWKNNIQFCTKLLQYHRSHTICIPHPVTYKYFRLITTQHLPQAVPNGLRSYEMGYNTSNQSTTPG